MSSVDPAFVYHYADANPDQYNVSIVYSGPSSLPNSNLCIGVQVGGSNRSSSNSSGSGGSVQVLLPCVPWARTTGGG